VGPQRAQVFQNLKCEAPKSGPQTVFFCCLFILFYLLVSPYYNTQYYNKNKNNIHDYRQGDRNSVSQLLRARIRTYKHKKTI
jgi:hypothetical protein